MAQRGPCPTLLLTLGLLAAGLALASGKSWARLQKKFMKEHVDFPRTPTDFPRRYCDDMMYNRGLYGKQTNTFIHASMQKICQVCSWGGIRISSGLHKSIFPFKVTICSYDKDLDTYTMERLPRRIVIGCWKQLPVLYMEWM